MKGTDVSELDHNAKEPIVCSTKSRVWQSLGTPENRPKSNYLLLIAAAAGYFLVNTIPVAIIISYGTAEPCQLWSRVFLWTFPYYLLSAGLAFLAGTVTRLVGW